LTQEFENVIFWGRRGSIDNDTQVELVQRNIPRSIVVMKNESAVQGNDDEAAGLKWERFTLPLVLLSMSEISQAPDKASGGYFALMLPCPMKSALINARVSGRKRKINVCGGTGLSFQMAGRYHLRRYQSETSQGGSSPSSAVTWWPASMENPRKSCGSDRAYRSQYYHSSHSCLLHRYDHYHRETSKI
jgi:hypothetical protein